MSRLTEDFVIARAKDCDLGRIKQLNCWGCDLADVSIIKRLRAVEVIALTVNNISSLAPFAECRKLRELYLRRNNISDVRQLSHLKELPDLRCLCLSENPFSERMTNYRSVVLRALPNLQKLDNVEVTPEEVTEALRCAEGTVGREVRDYAHQQLQSPQQPFSEHTSPQQIPQLIPQQKHSYQHHCPPTQQQRYQQQQQHYQHQLHPLRHQNDRSSGSEWQESGPQTSYREVGLMQQPDLPHKIYTESINHQPFVQPSFQSGCAWENGDGWGPEERLGSRRHKSRFVHSSTLPPDHRRPGNRSSNPLHAILSLMKELDYATLAVLKQKVQSHMDEMAAE